MKIEQFVVEGLGHQSYFVTDGESGTAAIIDPRRDIDVYLQAANRAGVRITHVLERRGERFPRRSSVGAVCLQPMQAERICWVKG